MISPYIERAMSKAIYEELEDGGCCGAIPQLNIFVGGFYGRTTDEYFNRS